MKIPVEELEIEYFRPASLVFSGEVAVRMTHLPTGEVAIGADYVGNGMVVRRKNCDVAYRKLLKAIGREEKDGESSYSLPDGIE